MNGLTLGFPDAVIQGRVGIYVNYATAPIVRLIGTEGSFAEFDAFVQHLERILPNSNCLHLNEGPIARQFLFQEIEVLDFRNFALRYDESASLEAPCRMSASTSCWHYRLTPVCI